MKKWDGYFTVEASMVFPMIIIEIVLMILLMFYQYNRCLMEQDLGTLMLRGVLMREESNQEKLKKIENVARNQNMETYIAWEKGKTKIVIKQGKLYLTQMGSLLALHSAGEVKREYVGHTVSPAFMLRRFRNMIGEEKDGR